MCDRDKRQGAAPVRADMSDMSDASDRCKSTSRRRFLQAAAAGAAAACLPEALRAAEKRKPNIVLILSDDHGYGSVGCQGLRFIPTPNMDSIAKAGVRFTNGYVTCPVCSPTRAGLMTGRYQQRFGHEDNPGPIPAAAPNFGLPESEKTLADYLKEQGYATGVVGKWHLGHRPACHPNKRGFDEFYGFLHGAHSYTDPGIGGLDPIQRNGKPVDEKEYLTDAFAREAVSFIERHKAEPFFLYLPFNAVHSPLEAPERYAKSFEGVTGPKARKWAGQLKAMDDAVGRVLGALRKSGVEEETLVFFLGDNGGYPLGNLDLNAPLSGRKGDTYEGGVRVPFMMQWKGHLPAGTVYGKTVSSLDVLPTAVVAAGGKPAANVEGVDLLPFVEQKRTGTPHEALYWRFVERSGARVGDWKLVRMGDGSDRLFDLSKDIGEKNDLAKTRPDKLKELQEAYRKWDAGNKPPAWRDSRRKAEDKGGTP